MKSAENLSKNTDEWGPGPASATAALRLVVLWMLYCSLKIKVMLDTFNPSTQVDLCEF